MVGDGKYNLDAVKEIKVTDSFLGLDMKHKACQNDEPVVECTTKYHLDTFLQKCGCFPFGLAIHHEQVK